MHYSMHIYREVRWLLNFTSDIATTNARVSALRQSLSQTEEQKLAHEQQPSDGSWGLGINAWYLRFYYSVDDVQECLSAPRYPLTFLDRINSPEKLDSQLDSDLFDDFTKTGIFNREELDETFSASLVCSFRLGQLDATHFIRNSRTRCVLLWTAGRIRRQAAGDNGWWIGRAESGRWTTWE